MALLLHYSYEKFKQLIKETMKLPSFKWFTHHLCAIAILASIALA